MGDLRKLKELVFAGDNRACFIERERILASLRTEFDGYDAPDRYARILAALLAGVSVPVEDCDEFAGRVLEALPDEGMCAPSDLLCAEGHMSPDYGTLLKIGLKGVLERIRAKAAEKGDADSRSFADNAEIVIHAIRDYAARYAVSARSAGKERMADALAIVPYEPAYDFYSALQSIWIMHMIASCYVGSRDYAFGRMDQYLLPYYEQALADGASEAELVDLLAGFMVKTDEICGRTTHNWQTKPVLCQAAKQYINIGGEHPNRLSFAILAAAERVCMAQPQIVVLLKPDADPVFTDRVFEALAVLTDKMNVYNYDLIADGLIARGVPPELARDFTYSACCTFDLHYHSTRLESYVPVPQIFLDVLHGGEYDSVDGILDALTAALRTDMQRYADDTMRGHDAEWCRKTQVLDALLLTDSSLECHYAGDGTAPVNVMNLFCPGVATLGDSLAVLDRLVFREKRYSYREFLRILDEDFAGNEALRHEILSFDRFGNDTSADEYTVRAGGAFLDAVDGLALRENYLAVGGFYSLERDNSWACGIGATPDGRKAGTPFSENQSPTYGADKNGVTALLRSLAKLPFGRTANGGLNLTFSAKVSPQILRSLILSYFEMGGFHVGISVLDTEVLRDAMKTPDKYKSLTVRLYGFSEYFISLPEWQQLAVLNRTAYGAEG